MIFNQFNSDDIVVGKINQVSSGFFGANNNLYISQSLFTTSSNQANTMIGANQFDVRNGQYYTNVYYNGEVYFSLAYGDYRNSGSSKYNSDAVDAASRTYTNESKVIYTQYKNILLQPGDEFFTFASGSESTSVEGEAIFAVNFSADKMKDQLDPGQFQINFRGQKGDFSYIDDSSLVNKQQNVYNLISGSIVNGVPKPHLDVNGNPVYDGIGLFYPKNGVAILNSIKLDQRVGILNSLQTRPSNNTSNTFKQYWRIWTRSLFSSIKNSRKVMAVRKSEFVPSTNYFVRVKNRDFNYTNNPTFVSNGTDGKIKGTIIYQDLINNPRTYITSVGLYNSNNELVAIGKLSKPVQKSFDNELLMKVRIDF